MFAKLSVIFADIKIQHTIFALPFAIMSAFIAAKGLPQTEKIIWIIVCMVGARSAAMAFNRVLDARFDARNPRTQDRALPAGRVDIRSYWLFLIVSSAIFIFAANMLNSLAFYLSPVALLIVFFYSFTKRFTVYSHFWLGLAIAISPVGAWVAIREEISFSSLILGAAVIFWLVGFDILYSCMDVEFDRSSGLKSIPQKFGIENALRIAFASHGVMILFLLGLLFFVGQLGVLYSIGVVVVAILLFYEHSLVRPDDLSKINIAFFNMNGIISLGLMVFVIIDCVWI
ncbi:MAG: UbiA-like polyprenyltransferase [Nitrospinota bacterium]|nr:UbiA-like polyprenyltransferase [Nitrospinota bacterium]